MVNYSNIHKLQMAQNAALISFSLREKLKLRDLILVACLKKEL